MIKLRLILLKFLYFITHNFFLVKSDFFYRIECHACLHEFTQIANFMGIIFVLSYSVYDIDIDFS